MGRILVVDDEIELMRALVDTLADNGHEAIGVSSGAEALASLEREPFDVVISDLMMPGMDGIQLLKAAREFDPHLVFVIMTGHGTVATAVDALKGGAFDYLLKPFKLQSLLPVLARGVELRTLRVENAGLRARADWLDHLAYESPRYQLVGSGIEMQRVVRLIEKVAPTNATVLVRGASGTGKELVARALHGNSARRDRPLVAVNCATLQESLLESELFGHEKGAFTGAVATKRGLIEVAEGGTLFVDEVAEMTSALQARLLRVLEDGSYRRVGSTEERKADVRVVAATNKPLEEEQKAGRFREDLYFRLNVVTIPLPSLAERRGDIPELVAHFLKTRQVGTRTFRVTPEAMELLKRYDWPGNVRELANVVERAQILAEGDAITPDDLPESLTRATAIEGDASPYNLQAMERRLMRDALAHTQGNRLAAARLLGVSSRTLYRMMERYGTI